MNFSEIINNDDVSNTLKRYNRYINEHEDEIRFVKNDIRKELLKLYNNVSVKLDGSMYVWLKKEPTDTDKEMINNIVETAIKSHTPGMPEFLREHLFGLHFVGDELFVETK